MNQLKVVYFLTLLFYNCAEEKSDINTKSNRESNVIANHNINLISIESSIKPIIVDQNNILEMDMSTNESNHSFALNKLGDLKIMPIGDSITQGSTGANWRCFLWTYLRNQTGFSDVNFVGSQTIPYAGTNSECPDNSFDGDHQGHGGWTTDMVLKVLKFTAAQYIPDIALIHMGTNDIAGGQSVESTISEIGLMIDSLRQYNVNVVVFVAGIIPNMYISNIDTTTKELNLKIQELVKEKTTTIAPVIFVDQYTEINPATDLADKLHPNYNGHVKMATKWYQAIMHHYTNVMAKTDSSSQIGAVSAINTNAVVKNTPSGNVLLTTPKISETQIGLVWQPVKDATYYMVVSSNVDGSLASKSVSAPWVVINADTSKSHYHSIFACNTIGCGHPTAIGPVSK